MRKLSKKRIATTAFLIFLAILALLIPFFVFNVDACWWRHRPPKPHHPPLGKFIHIQFTCSQSGKPIVGLPVTIGTTTITTDANGWVVFGSGYGSGTYTYTFEWWDGPHSTTVIIDCTKKNWYYYEELMNLEVHKWFFVDTENNGYPPIEGLEVTLSGYGTQITDADGYVEWILDYPFGDYTLEWVWNSVPASEPVHFEVGQGIWEKENYLEPKSGGGNNLHLAEEHG